MLPQSNRLRRKLDFAETLRSGRRAGRRDVVVHLLVDSSAEMPGRALSVRAPRVGLVVGKQVGPAVVRKRVSRRLREALRQLVPELPEGSRLVVRALPSAQDAQVREFAEQLKSAVDKLTSAAQNPTSRREP